MDRPRKDYIERSNPASERKIQYTPSLNIPSFKSADINLQHGVITKDRKEQRAQRWTESRFGRERGGYR